jgi:hypothetical protein
MRTFLNIHNDKQVTEIHPPDPAALRVFEAMKAAIEAETTLDKAQRDPSLNYTGQYEPVDFWGEQEIAFNEAVNALGAAIKDLVRE